MPEYPWIIYRMSEGPLTTKEVHQGVNEQLNRKLGTDWGYSEYEWANLLQGFRPLPIRTASGTIAHFEDGADDVPMKSVVANIEPIQSGTGTPSPSNPRPISGTSVLNVEQAGKNLVESKLEHCGIGAVGVLVVSSSQPYDMQIAKVKSGATYTITTDENTLVGGFFTSYPVNGSTTYDGQRVVQSSKTFTAPIDGYFAFRTSFGYATAQLEVGSTSTEYTPYVESTTTPIALGQTVYGGTADVVGGSGESEWGYIASYNGETITEPWLSSIDAYAEGTLPSIGAEVVYKLATPESFTFTGQPINSLLGVNNVWTDSGEVLDVEYRSNF